MAKVVSQNIPGELADAYDQTLCRSAIWIPGSSIRMVRKRPPFELKPMRNLSMATPSAEQRIVRRAFKSCTVCYNKQPYSGGAVPPAPGPRNRSWWFDDAVGSGLWYYDYFIQQTFSGFYTGPTPAWCIIGSLTPFAYNTVKQNDPDAVSSSAGCRDAMWDVDNYQWWVYHQFDLTPASLAAVIAGYYDGIVKEATLHFWMYNVYAFNVETALWVHRTGRVHIGQVDYWNPAALTWNNKPAYPPEKFHRRAYMQSGPYGPWNQNLTEHYLDISSEVNAAIAADSKYLTIVFRVTPMVDSRQFGVDPEWFLTKYSPFTPPVLQFR